MAVAYTRLTLYLDDPLHADISRALESHQDLQVVVGDVHLLQSALRL